MFINKLLTENKHLQNITKYIAAVWLNKQHPRHARPYNIRFYRNFAFT